MYHCTKIFLTLCQSSINSFSLVFLQSWVAKKSCHCQTLINECSISDYPSNFEGLQLAPDAILFQTAFVLHSLEVIFLFLMKKSRQKAIEIETAFFFILLGIPRDAHWIISFILHISVITPTTPHPHPPPPYRYVS